MTYSPLPSGIIMAFGGPVANIPSGWLHCDGSPLSRTDYAALYAALYDTATSKPAWGYGDGSTTFNLPDLRGRFLRGQDNGQGQDRDRTLRVASNTGGNTGDHVGSIQGMATSTSTGTQGGTKSSTGLVNANESSHTHSPGTFATSIGLSGSASYLTGTVTFADITHVHATSAGGGGTYVTTDAASLNATFTVWGAGVVHYAKTTDIGSLNFFNTLGPQSSASVGIAGGSYSLTGSN